jgi:hypothetical protein
MTKFSTYVGDALKFHDTTHGALRAAVRLATRDDVSHDPSNGQFVAEEGELPKDTMKRHPISVTHKNRAYLKGGLARHPTTGEISTRYDAQANMSNALKKFADPKPKKEIPNAYLSHVTGKVSN